MSKVLSKVVMLLVVATFLFSGSVLAKRKAQAPTPRPAKQEIVKDFKDLNLSDMLVARYWGVYFSALNIHEPGRVENQPGGILGRGYPGTCSSLLNRSDTD